MRTPASSNSNGTRRSTRIPVPAKLEGQEWTIYACPDPECDRIVTAKVTTRGKLPCTASIHRHHGTYPRMEKVVVRAHRGAQDA